MIVPDLDYAGIRTAIRESHPVNARPEIPETLLILAADYDGVTVDFLLAVPGFDEEIVRRAKPEKVYDRMIPICTAEDLLIMKMIAGRERDLLDIKELLQVLAGRNLDFAYLENWLGQFAEALEDPGMLKRFQALRRSG